MNQTEKKVGCPLKYTKRFRKELLLELWEYIENTQFPFIKEFAYTHKIGPQRFSEFDEFSEALSILKAKRAANLMKGGLGNKVNAGFAQKIVALDGYDGDVADMNKSELSVSVNYPSLDELKQFFEKSSDGTYNEDS